VIEWHGYRAICVEQIAVTNCITSTLLNETFRQGSAVYSSWQIYWVSALIVDPLPAVMYIGVYRWRQKILAGGSQTVWSAVNN